MMALSGFKSLGDAGWVGFFSNIFPDRDVLPDAPQGERFTLDAHEEYAAWANSDEANLPELWFWHLPNVKMGKATAVEVAGPFVVAVGKWGEDDIGQKAKAYFAKSEDEWAMSHGYTYRVGDRVAGEYRKYRTHEVTVLSPEWAANPVTAFSVEGTDMAGKGLKEELGKALTDLLGVTKEDAEKVASEGQAQEKALKAKLDGDEAAGQKAGDATEPTAAADEPVGDDTLALALADALIAQAEGEQKRVALEGEVKGLKEKLEALETTIAGEIKALKDDAESRKTLLPRAVAQALQQRASEKGAEVSAEEVVEDAKKQAAALKDKGAPDSAADPLGWMAAQAGLELPTAGKQ